MRTHSDRSMLLPEGLCHANLRDRREDGAQTTAALRTPLLSIFTKIQL